MAPSNNSDSALGRKFGEICSELNLDKAAADEAFNSFQRIQINYTLDGEKLHWLACALYVACRKGMTPTVGGRGGFVEGNCVSLTRLLRSCKLSLVDFFNKMKKWSDMANLPLEMRNKLEHLERNFHVSATIFKKFGTIFKHLFKTPMLSPVKQANRSRKRKMSLTSSHVFQFCWTLFVHVKANFKMISDDLVNSYHLLLACIDFCYSNVLVVENAKELLNAEFSELPPGFGEDHFKAPEPVPCIVEGLCARWEGLTLDAKGIKEHWLKPCIKRMVDKRIFACRDPTHFLGFMDPAYFEKNLRAISREYDQLLLNSGDFDERVFLNNNANDELGAANGDFDKTLNASMQNVQKIIKEAKSLAPTTPLSNRHFLNNRENMGAFSPVTNAVQTVSRLQSLLLGCKTEPSQTLQDVFESCSPNPSEKIQERVKELGDKFLSSYCQNLDGDRFTQPNTLAKRMLDSAVMLYYKCMEKIMIREQKKWNDNEKSHYLSNSLSHELFHVSLFSCCMEIVLFSHNSEKVFPWIVELFGENLGVRFQPIHFYRVIELIIRDEDGLSRDIVKHLNNVEEQVLESMAWKSDSVLWDMIKSNGTVPSCQDVTLSVSTGDNVFMSPNPVRKVEDRAFVSPGFINARRRLFDPVNDNSSQQQPQIIHLVPVQTQTISGEVRQMLILHPSSIQQTLPPTTQAPSIDATPTEQPKINKTGSLGLFFRKVYHLAWLRLRDLSEKLNISDEELRRKIWTCFEYSIRNHTGLMRDRHLDQILMCAVYSITKITLNDRNFQDIMKCYRQQPQAQSHVYRCVLLLNEPKADDKPDDEKKEERGDLIQFYNQVFIPEVKQFIMKFNGETGSPTLSPLPRLAANAISPYRRISNKHSLYISPLKGNTFPPSPKRPLSYHFLRSPAKDLRAINSMMRQNAPGSEKKVIKRILQDDSTSENANNHKQGYGHLTRTLCNERQNYDVDEDDNGDVEME
ncbi:retinoblastoma-like protein 1 isoform X2 [Brevipalpus obovatus]|uniref:retinoblastoma-like protein 1 isoform X2 n=1 Tax=Brevipalpus obovatus TaxID=246614 RepID=UPI003D9EDC23